jgi:hypothetical protein
MHVTRTVVFATASAVLALAATGSASAWSGTVVTSAAHGAALVSAGIAQAPAVANVRGTRIAQAPHARSTKTAPTARATTETRIATRATTVRSSARASAAKPAGITIKSYVNAPGSQHAVNACNLVLWTTKPLWLAAHNYCGFQWLATVPTGKVITITKGAAAGRYVVTGHLRLGRQSGALPAVNADLVLQTCVGSGTGLTLARRIR